MITKLDENKFEITWPIVTVRVGGHTVTGRPATITALTGATRFAETAEAQFVGTQAQCERQL